MELVQSGSRVSLLAVYLGYLGERNHFYAENGRWITSMAFSPPFSVSRFASPEELAAVLSRIPKEATPNQFDAWRDNEMGPSREDGADLIKRMTEFRTHAERTYQVNLNTLDAARFILANSRSVRYLSLSDMASLLLSDSAKVGDEFPSSALFAVHTAIQRSELAFAPLSPSSDIHRKNNLYEVFPQTKINTLDKVALVVREFTEASMRQKKNTQSDLEKTTLGRFVIEAKKALKISRAKREPTTHGILKPSTGVVLERTHWSPASKEIIYFLEHWASYGLFPATSRFHAYGALILRALDAYQDVLLDQRTAWTFLQEIGVINPWEIPSRYRVRLPATTIARGSGLVREVPQQIEDSTRPDIAAGARKQHNQSAIFCIDSPSTTLIDDGISLERTQAEDEFWIHVHAADPASSIQPDSELCKFMELIPENIYLPGHFQAMLPSSLGEDDSKDFKSESLTKQFSLRNGSPALTFSAKINTLGDILDTHIEASTLGEVIYMDPEAVSKFCDEPQPPTTDSFHLSVGRRPERPPFEASREMKSADALTQQERSDLLKLHELAGAIKQKRLEKGAWPYFFPRPSVSVMFSKSEQKGPWSDTISIPEDPYINVSTSPSAVCSVVSNTMVLAGEIAARWCAARDIPVPFRRDTKTSQNYGQALEYATKTIYPLIEQGIEPTSTHRQELTRRTGGIELSSKPGPYFLLGLDMYAKATSPLRRFGDLLTHWQIHAALAHERSVKRTLDSTKDNLDEILPFGRDKMESMLPLLEMREKMGRTISRGIQDWILIALVRAWLFEKTAPKKLVFTVDSRWRGGLLGRLDLLGLNAALDTVGLHGTAVISNVQINDRFEVELADINVHSGQILVKALRCLPAA